MRDLTASHAEHSRLTRPAAPDLTEHRHHAEAERSARNHGQSRQGTIRSTGRSLSAPKRQRAAPCIAFRSLPIPRVAKMAVNITIPPLTADGARFRIRGKGTFRKRRHARRYCAYVTSATLWRTIRNSEPFMGTPPTLTKSDDIIFICSPSSQGYRSHCTAPHSERWQAIIWSTYPMYEAHAARH